MNKGRDKESSFWSERVVVMILSLGVLLVVMILPCETKRPQALVYVVFSVRVLLILNSTLIYSTCKYNSSCLILSPLFTCSTVSFI